MYIYNSYFMHNHYFQREKYGICLFRQLCFRQISKQDPYLYFRREKYFFIIACYFFLRCYGMNSLQIILSCAIYKKYCT